MVQTAIPFADVFNSGGWSSNAGFQGDPLYNSIASDPTVPESASDEQFIKTIHQPANEVYVTALNEFVYTQDTDGTWELFVRAQKASTSVAILDMRVQLIAGYIDEDNLGDILFEELVEDVPETLTTFVFNIPKGSVEGSPGWTAAPNSELYVRIEAITS